MNQAGIVSKSNVMSVFFSFCTNFVEVQCTYNKMHPFQAHSLVNFDECIYIYISVHPNQDVEFFYHPKKYPSASAVNSFLPMASGQPLVCFLLFQISFAYSRT